ncbi:MAG TPA: PIN domain-containing protein [Sphingomicrobium sp.]
MILVDTSVWADHFRSADAELEALLAEAQVLVHPFVIGELALGNLRERDTTLGALTSLPMAMKADDSELLGFVEAAAVFGRGIGLVDAHLLASARLTPGSALWTRDKRLASIAAELDVAYAVG